MKYKVSGFESLRFLGVITVTGYTDKNIKYELSKPLQSIHASVANHRQAPIFWIWGVFIGLKLNMFRIVTAVTVIAVINSHYRYIVTVRTHFVTAWTITSFPRYLTI